MIRELNSEVVIMLPETEKNYLLEVVETLQREVVVISPSFEVMAANRYAKEKFGTDMVGQSCYEVFFRRSNPCNECPMMHVLQPDKSEEESNDHINFEADETNVTYYPIQSGDCPECMVRLDFDPPKMGRLEKKLQLSNAFLHNLIMSSVDAVIAADKSGKVLIFNDAAAKILGYSREEALNSLDIRDIYPGDTAHEIMRKLRSEENGEPGKLAAYRVEILAKDQERIPISLNASIIYENSHEIATIGFFHDLRETIRMEKELEQTRVQLFQSAKMAAIGKLAAGVAHQINNPLGGISLFAQLLLEEQHLNEEAREDVQRILYDSQRCRDTVRELLEFARQSSYKAKPEDINRALTRTLFLLEKHAIFQNIVVQKDFDDNLPYVPCDLQQLSHVFMNIILNAAEAMDGQGTLTLSTAAVHEDWVRIVISDTGPGIPEDVLPSIFDPFFTTKEEGKGTGLGLSVAYRIVENHDGVLTACNNPEGGSSFCIELPIAPSEEGEGDEDE